MKKFLLSEKGVFYKANLHCHTNLSDANKTPEEIKKMYKQEGYSVVAYTDHDIFIPHNDLTDDNFVALNGFEIEVDNKTSDNFDEIKTCHICFIAKDKNNFIHPVWHREKYLFGNAPKYAHLVKFDKSVADFEREYSGECISNLMKTGRDKGFFVTYNHPTWSMEDYSQYINYDNMNAMEIYNHGCFVGGYEEQNGRVYDDMLRSGKRIFCLATDDNHNKMDDSFGGFVMIKAENLTYESIIKSLEAGDFYASEGPLIENLWYEDGIVHIKSSKAKKIIITKGIRTSRVLEATEGAFEINSNDIYFRLTVVDENGKKAYTNAYFVDEIKKEP